MVYNVTQLVDWKELTFGADAHLVLRIVLKKTLDTTTRKLIRPDVSLEIAEAQTPRSRISKPTQSFGCVNQALRLKRTRPNDAHKAWCSMGVSFAKISSASLLKQRDDIITAMRAS